MIDVYTAAPAAVTSAPAAVTSAPATTSSEPAAAVQQSTTSTGNDELINVHADILLGTGGQSNVYLGKLLERMDEITAAEGGDGVRRYLGTVGTTSPVFGIQKVFLKLADVIEPKDPELYFETLERMVTKSSDADAEAYAANCVTFSSAKGKPEDFYARAAKQVVDARKEWLVLLQQLGLDS